MVMEVLARRSLHSEVEYTIWSGPVASNEDFTFSHAKQNKSLKYLIQYICISTPYYKIDTFKSFNTNASTGTVLVQIPPFNKYQINQTLVGKHL